MYAPENCLASGSTAAVSPATVAQSDAYSTAERDWELGAAGGEHTTQLCGQLLGDGQESYALIFTGFDFSSLPDLPDDAISITGIEITFECMRNADRFTINRIQDHSIGLWRNGVKNGRSRNSYLRGGSRCLCLR